MTQWMTNRRSSCQLALLMLVVLLAGCQTPPLAQATSPLLAIRPATMDVIPDVQASGTPLCRLGINVSSFPSHQFYIDDFDVTSLRIGWYIDYRADPSRGANNGAAYAMVVNVADDEDGNYHYSPTGEALDAIIAAYPGGIYIIGNEPDRRELQHDVLPENYAYIYHDAYEEIKGKDPTAQVWAGAIVQPTPVRLAYLDRVLAAYQARYGSPMPVDGWAIHSFLLNERSCAAYNNDLNRCWGADIPPGIDVSDGIVLTPQDNAQLELFAAGIVRFRTWMAANGYRDTALYVSEYGVLMPPIFGFPTSAVNAYMRQTFEYMLNTRDETLGYPADDYRLVQRFAWFSTFDPNFNGFLYQSKDPSNIMQPPFVLSEMGVHYSELAAQMAESSDLAILSIQVIDDPGQIVATIANSGNRLAPTQATVRFFEGNTLASAKQIGDDVSVAVAGCGDTQTVTMAWEGAGEDTAPPYRLWVQISETDFPDANPENDLYAVDGLHNGISSAGPTVNRALP